MFELNDLYGVIFAVPSIVLIYGGVQGAWGDWATWVGTGSRGMGRFMPAFMM
jgi:beta-carotene 3-hydroxylase